MREKREAARAAAQERRAAAHEVVPWLRALGFSAGEGRRAATRCENATDASLERRVRLALTCFGPRTQVRVAPRTTSLHT